MTDSIGENERLAVAEGAHARRFDDEIIVLDLSGGDYFGLNAVGARIWEGFVAGRTCAEIARALVSTHDVEYDVALNDCLALGNELYARALLRRV